MNSSQSLRFALPKGRMQKGIFQLLAEAGISIRASERGYRPVVSIAGVETKILKPQNIVEMLQLGSRDLGFAGADWVQEYGANGHGQLVEILDTGLDPVRLVAAAPQELVENGNLPDQSLRVASEYEILTKQWIKKTKMDATFVKSNGATEVFPPEDADLIVDNTATGATLRDNGLLIVDELMRSSTRLYASQAAYDNPQKRSRIDDIRMLLQAVLSGRSRRMVEVNVSAEALDELVQVIPAMQKPTIAPLFGESGFAVRAAVLRADIPELIPKIKSLGGRDIVVSDINQIVS